MLFKLKSNGDLQEITEIPHRDQYDAWAAELTDEQFDAVYDELLGRIDNSEIETSS